MKFSVLFAALFAALSLSACGDSSAGSGESAAAPAADTADAAMTPNKNKMRQITWDDLMPQGEDEVLSKLMRAHMEEVANIAEGGAKDEMVQIGTFNVVEALDGQRVRIPGYVIPFNFNKTNEYSEFLLVPYAGACIHAPPPPPNQTVYVKVDKPVKVESIWDPVWVEGAMSTAKHEASLSDAAYTLSLTSLETYKQ